MSGYTGTTGKSVHYNMADLLTPGAFNPGIPRIPENSAVHNCHIGESLFTLFASLV